MVQFTVNPNRHDPYKQFKFRVRMEGRIVAGIAKVGALRRSTEVIEHREGGDPSTSRKSPGRTQFQPIVLERGLTHDTEFEDWANKVWRLGQETSLADFRRDIVIELINEAGQIVIAYNVHRCWPSEYVAYSGRAGDQVRSRRQSYNRQGSRADNPRIVSRPRRRGDRIERPLCCGYSQPLMARRDRTTS